VSLTLPGLRSATAVALVAMFGLVACGSSGGDDAAGATSATPEPVVTCTAPAGGLVLAVGVHANAPAPDVPAGVGCLIETAVRGHLPISVVGIDGTPAVDPAVSARTFTVRTANPGATRQDVDSGIATVVNAVRGLKADSDGSDVVAAFGLAHDLAVSGSGGRATVVVLDPLLPDRGALRLTEPGWAEADPAGAADTLDRGHRLPPGDGLDYRLVGVGYTAPPQEPLPTALRQNVTAIWTAVLTRGGAHVVADPTPRQGPAPRTSFTTETVAVPAVPQPSLCPGVPIVYDNTSALGFRPDSEALVDPDDAAHALDGVAAWLRADPARQAAVLGTTARIGDETGQLDLSRRRAAAVRRVLLDLGAAADQVVADGVGSRFSAYIPDADDPIARQHNRSVRITLSGPADPC